MRPQMADKYVKHKIYKRRKSTSKFGGEPGYNLDIISYIQIVFVYAPK